jgi:hypothetical protein
MPVLVESCVEECSKSLKSLFTSKKEEPQKVKQNETIVKLEECFAFIGKNMFKDTKNQGVMKAIAELADKAFV